MEGALSLNMLIFQVCNLTFLMCKMGVECGSDRIIQLKWREKERGGEGEGDGGGGREERERDLLAQSAPLGQICTFFPFPQCGG